MADRPDTIVLVFDADSGLAALILDVAKKLLGRGDCALCELTYGPVGKRSAWAGCESRLGVAVKELHRDQLPAAWNIARAQLPCILAQAGDATPTVLVTREQLAACQQRVDALEHTLRAALHLPALAP